MRIGIDMLGMQSPDHRGRGIGRCCTDLIRALFREASSYRLVLYRHDGLPTDGLPEGPNTSTRTLPRDPGGRTSSEALARIVSTNPDGLDSLLIPIPFEPSADYRIPDRPAHGLRRFCPRVNPEGAPEYETDNQVDREGGVGGNGPGPAPPGPQVPLVDERSPALDRRRDRPAGCPAFAHRPRAAWHHRGPLPVRRADRPGAEVARHSRSSAR